jgi:hypothetical protein
MSSDDSLINESAGEDSNQEELDSNLEMEIECLKIKDGKDNKI